VCHLAIIERVASDFAGFKEGFGLHGQSQQMVNGSPETEVSRTVNVDGERAAVDVERSVTGATVRRSISHPQPYRRDSFGRRRRAEDEAAVTAMLRVYNQEHGTDYQVQPVTDEEAASNDEHGIDAIAFSASEAFPKIEFQVVKADATPWDPLA